MTNRIQWGRIRHVALAATTSCALALCVTRAAHADCLDDAATWHGVSPVLARAIAMQESGMRADIISTPNSNGTYDIGLMQINSSWLPRLARYGITGNSLLDACVNAYVGTWILQQNIAQYGQTWEAVGAYNAASPSRRQRYATAVYNRLQQLVSLSLPPPGAQGSVSSPPVAIEGTRKAAGFRQSARSSPTASFSSGGTSTRSAPRAQEQTPATASLATYEVSGE